MMNDYIKALHQRFFREPDFTELEADGLYSFQKDEEQRACEIIEREVSAD